MRVGAEIDPSFGSTMDGASGKLGDFSDSAEAMAGGYSQAVQQVIAAQQEADQAWETAKATLAELQQAYDAGAISVETLARGAEDLKSAFDEANPSIKALKDSAGEAESSVKTLAEAFTEITGIALTFEALKEAATETVTAFGGEQAAAIALTAALGGNKDVAAELIEQAKNMADALGQSNSSVIAATQALIAFGVPADNVRTVLQGMGTAALASNNPLDVISQRFDSMASTGTLSNKSLVALRLTVDDIGAAMGKAGEPTKDIKNAFQSLGDTAARAGVLAEAELTKFPTLANDAADSVNNAWNKVKNATENAFVEIGSQLGGFAALVTPIVQAIKGIETGFIALLVPVKVAVDTIVAGGGIILSTLTGLGQAALDTAQGKFGEASDDIRTALVKAASYATGFADNVKADWTSSAAAIAAIWDTSMKSVGDGASGAKKPIDDLSASQQLLNQASKDLLAGATLLGDVWRKSQQPVLDLGQATTNLAVAQAHQQQAAQDLLKAQNDLDNAREQEVPDTEAVTDAIATQQTAYKNVQSATKDVAQAQKDLQAAQKLAEQATKDQAQTDSDYATMLNTLGKSSLLNYAEAIANVGAAKSKYIESVTNEITIQAQLDALIAAGKQGTTDYTTVQGALTAAHQQVAQALKDLNAAQTTASTSQSALSAATKELLSDQTSLDGLYKDHLTGDTTNLQTAVAALSTARQNEASAANALIVAEGNLAVVKAASASTEQDLKTATDDAKIARENLTAATKTTADAEGTITQQFGLSKTAAEVLAGATVSLTEVFKDLGLKSASSLQDLADAAQKEYTLIANSGTASANQLRDAQIKALQDQKAAYIANGSDLSSEDQKQLDHLLAQQDSFNRAHIDQWMQLYKSIQSTVDGFFSDLSGKLVTDLLFGGTDNSALKSQIADLQSQLADTTAAYQQNQADIQAQMKQATADNTAQLQKQLADFQSQLDQKTADYATYVANYKQQLSDLEQASADQTAQQVQQLQAALQQEQSDYAQAVTDTQQKMADVTQASKENLDQQLSNLQDSLASQTESYDRFVEDTNTKLSRIGENLAQDIGDKTTDTNRNITDKQTDIQRAQQDASEQINDLKSKETAANKAATEEQIADINTALQRKIDDANTYIQRQQQDLQTYTDEHKQAADEQVADAELALQRQTQDYDAYVANNKQQQQEDTDNANKQLAQQLLSLQAALIQKQVQLAADKILTQEKIQQVTATNAQELAKQEADLKTALDKENASYLSQETSIKQQMADATTAAKTQLDKQEADLQKQLDAQTAAYQKYVNGINGYTDASGVYHKGQLDALKDQFKSVWGDISDLVQKAADKMLSSMLTSFLKPLTDKIASFIAGSLADLLGNKGFGGVQNAVGVDLPDALSGLDDAFGDLGDAAIKAATDIDDAIGGASGAGAGGASGAVGAIGQVTGSILSSVSQIVGMVTGAISAITGIIGIFQNMHQEDTLKAIEKETARMAIYLGDQGGNSIQGLMWRLVNDIEFGEMEKALNIISADIDKVAGPFWAYGLDNLKAISSNTYWALQKLQEIDNKTGNTSGSVNVEGTDLSTVISALDIINNTLVAESQTIPWFQTALQNINNGVVACAGWLQGILNLFQSGAAKVGGATAGSQPMADLAKFVGANFTDLENWLFSAFGRSMALPALPSPEQIPSSLAGGTAAASSATGSSTAAASTSTTAHAQQSTAGPTTAAPAPDIISFLTAQFTTTDGILSKAGDGIVAVMTGANVMLASLGAGVRQVDASLEKIGVGILAAFGTVTASLKTSQELVSANENKILDQIVILNARESQELSLMGLVRDAVGQFATMTANQLSELINVTKMIISVPASTTSAAFAGAAGAVSQIASSGGGHTFNFPNARITGTNEARQALDQAVNELRRRNRII